MSTEITIEMKPFDKKVARINYHVEIYFDEKSKIDLKERMRRVIRQSIEEDFQESDMLS